jgi:hypothetical protein
MSKVPPELGQPLGDAMQLTLSFDVCHGGKDKQNWMSRGRDRRMQRGPAATRRSRPPPIVRMQHSADDRDPR